MKQLLHIPDLCSYARHGRPLYTLNQQEHAVLHDDISDSIFRAEGPYIFLTVYSHVSMHKK